MNRAIETDTYPIELNVANDFTFTWENIVNPIKNKRYFKVISSTRDVLYSISFGLNCYILNKGDTVPSLIPFVCCPEKTDLYLTNSNYISQMKVSIYKRFPNEQIPDQISIAIQFFD